MLVQENDLQENQALRSRPCCEHEHRTSSNGRRRLDEGKGTRHGQHQRGQRKRGQGQGQARYQGKKCNGKAKGKGDETPQSTYFVGYRSTFWWGHKEDCWQTGKGQQGNKVNVVAGKVANSTTTPQQRCHRTESRTELIEQHTVVADTNVRGAGSSTRTALCGHTMERAALWRLEQLDSHFG